MGMLASAEHPLPWFRRDHPLQKHKALIAGFGTGYCGCLTTFASWNTQMVRMLDGTDTILGSQVAPALFGYAIGLCGAFSCFLMGRHLHEWISSMHGTEDPLVDEDPDEEMESNLGDTGALQKGQSSELKKENEASAWWKGKLFVFFFSASAGPPLMLAGLFACFFVGAIVYDVPFYQELVLESLLAPLGALLRWKLSKLNQADLQNVHLGEFTANAISWIPLGTLVANMIASVLSALLMAIQLRYLPNYDDPWISQLLPTIETGFCGSLSTVSTFIKEIFTMERSSRSFLYATGSLALAMLLGLAVYSPVVRS
jgi:CrcB protein